jgi:hypothetical protein
MSELTLWVCGTPTGPKEIIRAYGTRPNSALCVAPLDDINLLDLKWYYLKPGTSERIDLEDGSHVPPEYYLNYETNTYVTPVPDPVPRYWKDKNDGWTATEPPEGITAIFTVITPRQDVEAVINEPALVTFETEKTAATRQRTIQSLINALQRMLDVKAQEKGYDSALSCVSYLGSSVTTFNNEATAMQTWRSNVWAWGYQQLAEAGVGPLPSASTLIASVLAQYPAPW